MRSIIIPLSSTPDLFRIKALFKIFNDCKEGDISMKSSFHFLMVLCLLTGIAGAQTKTTKVSKTQVVAQKTSFQKFYDRLKISYWGSYQSSSLGQWDYRALDEKGQKYNDYAHNMFNQVSFNYNFGWKMNFVVNPRWTTNFGSTSKYPSGSGAATGFLILEDTLVALQGTLYSSESGKFNWWARMGARLPTSSASRAGNITAQPEIFTIPSYDFNKKWQLGSYIQIRQWVYQQRYTGYRYRIYTAPYIQHTINDTTKVTLFVENYSENRKNLKSQNGKSPNFKGYWNNVMVGLGKDITPKMNIMPFLGYMTDADKIQQRPLDPAWFGFWLSYQIK